MRLHLNFTESFRGVVSVGKSTYTDPIEAHDCSIRGLGSTKYRLDISHKKCQTVFDVSFHYHSSSESRDYVTVAMRSNHLDRFVLI